MILSLKFVNFRSRKKDTHVNTQKCMPSHMTFPSNSPLLSYFILSPNSQQKKVQYHFPVFFQNMLDKSLPVKWNPQEVPKHVLFLYHKTQLTILDIQKNTTRSIWLNTSLKFAKIRPFFSDDSPCNPLHSSDVTFSS